MAHDSLPGALGDATPVQDRIQNLLDTHPIVLFMKGTALFPMCGFSGRAVQLMAANGVKAPFTLEAQEAPSLRAVRSSAEMVGGGQQGVR